MSSKRSGATKAVTWAPVAAYVLFPLGTGWLYIDRIECSYCLGENLRHASAVFGYLVLGGFALSYTKPERPGSSDSRSLGSSTPQSREDVRETSFWIALLLAGTFFVTGFNWKLFFL